METCLIKLIRGEKPASIKPGIYFDMPRQIYDNIAALNCTVLKKWLAVSDIPSEFAYWNRTHWDESPTEALLIGSALDSYLLNADFDHQFAVAPKVDRRTTTGKTQWADFESLNVGKTILTEDQFEKVHCMSSSLRECPAVDGVFQHCQKAVLVGELFGFSCKMECDLWNERIFHILDLKTCRDVSPKWFTKAFIDFGYSLQATFYLLLAQACGFENKKIMSFVAIKNEEPWTVAVYSFAPYENPDHWLLFDACRLQLARAAGALVLRLERNDWRDDQDWKSLIIPEWSLRQAKLEALAAA
jgi:PDDEXK-like uncharacterized protein DUF3799